MLFQKSDRVPELQKRSEQRQFLALHPKEKVCESSMRHLFSLCY